MLGSHSTFYLHKPGFFERENKRVFSWQGVGMGGILFLEFQGLIFEYSAKAWKIKSIDFVNKPLEKKDHKIIVFAI